MYLQTGLVRWPLPSITAFAICLIKYSLYSSAIIAATNPEDVGDEPLWVWETASAEHVFATRYLKMRFAHKKSGILAKLALGVF